MTERRTFQRDIIEETLHKVARNLAQETDAYLIGGGAMIFYGRKVATKDIDIVFPDADSLRRFKLAAIGSDFNPLTDPGQDYRNIGAWIILEAASGIRLDLFHHQVCNALELTDTVKARAAHFRNLGKLHIYLMAPEDIVLFKGITEREADLEDIRILAEAGLDWGIVEEECLSQSGSGKWAILFLDKLDELRARYGISPRLDRLRDHAEAYVLEETFLSIIGNKELGFREIHEVIHAKTGYSESWTRGILKQLDEEGLIESRSEGRRKLYKRAPHLL